MRCLRNTVCTITLIFFMRSVESAPSYDLSGLPAYITMYGDRSGGSIGNDTDNNGTSFYYESSGTDNLLDPARLVLWYYPGRGNYENCPSSVYIDPTVPWIPDDSAKAFYEWVNMRMGQGVRMTATPGTKYVLASGHSYTLISCSIVGAPSNRWRMTMKWAPGNQSHTGKPPEPVKPICTLGNDIKFDIKTNSLNVEGIQKQEYMPILCSGGGLAAAYRLRLTSSTESNGNIIFGNNVGVSFHLGSTALPVNGNGITLSLTSSSNPILTATLKGTSISAGKTDASGILILEAL